VSELTDVAAGHALRDALDRAIDRNFAGIWRDRYKQEPDFYEMARNLRQLGFVIVKKEQDG
jgi:hypothetical protein